MQVLEYRTGSTERAVVEGFLQRCAFDDRVSLEQMEATEPLAAYLAASRAPDGSYEFRHEAHLITWGAAGMINPYLSDTTAAGSASDVAVEWDRSNVPVVGLVHVAGGRRGPTGHLPK